MPVHMTSSSNIYVLARARPYVGMAQNKVAAPKIVLALHCDIIAKE